jgi:hypothetical protein
MPHVTLIACILVAAPHEFDGAEEGRESNIIKFQNLRILEID